MKHYFAFMLVLVLSVASVRAQVGINTSNPQGVFNIDGAKDNLQNGKPSEAQQANDIAVTQGGNMGIGITTPTNKLHIKGSNPLRLEGTKKGMASTDSLMVKDATGVVKTIAPLGQTIPISESAISGSAVFKLKYDLINFLNGKRIGESSPVAMELTKNTIAGLAYNESNATITIPPGMYMIMFVYEALHNNTNCTNSSYYIDFPVNQGDYIASLRVHNTAYHLQGAFSNHGGTIVNTNELNSTIYWQIQLGRGQSGNCTGPGMTLKANSTRLLLFKLGS